MAILNRPDGKPAWFLRKIGQGMSMETDMAMSSWSAYYDNGQTDEGVVFVFMAQRWDCIDLVWMAKAITDRLGSSVSGAGDVNGDGYSDIIAGRGLRSKASMTRAVYLWYGSPTKVRGEWQSGECRLVCQSDQIDAWFGAIRLAPSEM
jgi:hypothetical protein